MDGSQFAGRTWLNYLVFGKDNGLVYNEYFLTVEGPLLWLSQYYPHNPVHRLEKVAIVSKKKKRTIVSFSLFKVLQSSYDIYSPHPPPPIHPHLLLLCVIMTLFSLHLLTSAYIHCKRYKNHYKNAAGFLICKTIFSPMLTKIKEFKKYPFKESS